MLNENRLTKCRGPPISGTGDGGRCQRPVSPGRGITDGGEEVHHLEVAGELGVTGIAGNDEPEWWRTTALGRRAIEGESGAGQ